LAGVFHGGTGALGYRFTEYCYDIYNIEDVINADSPASTWVDRLASAWLIRRFIDPGAHLLWLASPADCPPDALGFDFDGATFSHVGVRVTFEVLLPSFGLETPALQRLGALVHPPAPVSFWEAFVFWLKLGFISFGGPAGQISIMHQELVENRRWISERRFLHALNYCMVLPGPEAQQLATYIGWLMHRTWGGIVAGVLFVLPSLFILIALSWIYIAFGEMPWWPGCSTASSRQSPPSSCRRPTASARGHLKNNACGRLQPRPLSPSLRWMCRSRPSCWAALIGYSADGLPGQVQGRWRRARPTKNSAGR
jgi:hypothetical protein